jgi:hypothetical protein
VRVEDFGRPVEGLVDEPADRMIHKPLGLNSRAYGFGCAGVLSMGGRSRS